MIQTPWKWVVAMTALSVAGSSVMAEIPADSPVRSALEKAEAKVAEIVAVPAGQRTFENTLLAMDDMSVTLENDTNYMMFMQYVSPDRAAREKGERAERDTVNWATELQTREDLYQAFEEYVATNPKLDGPQKRLFERTQRDYRRAGMALPKEKRDELVALRKQISDLGIEFEKNIRSDETRTMLLESELSGMSDDYLAQQRADGHYVDGVYMIGMDYPSFNPIMDFCDNEDTREKVWLDYKRRGGQRNVDVLEKLLKARSQEAEMLGYATTADYEIEVRMARTAQNVRDFYAKLRPLVRTKAELDFAEFQNAKRDETGRADAVFRPWDMSYYKNRLLQTQYAVDSREAQQYFPFDSVTKGLFDITQSLYGLEYREVTQSKGDDPLPLWHPDVKHYEVYDKADGHFVGEFYMDMFPRPEDDKYSHAAQWGMRQHKKFADGQLQTPIAVLVCNFTKPTPDKPSLLTHDEVETYFHEFGHCLHTLLSEVDIGRFSGTGVAGDFVEAPSQMFENWVWDADVLRTFARHYKTGQPIPTELVDGMLKARHLGSGIDAEHQFYYGISDLTYHSAPHGEIDTTQVGIDLLGQVEMYESVPGTRFQAGFGHLVGYQAGYYGYMWSLVYACDMFQRFKELGMMSPEAGMYYREHILSQGGQMEEADMIHAYLGREPDMRAFLRHLGLSDSHANAGGN
ncbi:MAG: Zn-dependent oligopeptidase [Phycisphaerales bacterium]|nr:Zn-dependent oligopeptidase [Phycisphaerales bacterium]